MTSSTRCHRRTHRRDLPPPTGLVIVAHPDDAEFQAGASEAAAGVVHLC